MKISKETLLDLEFDQVLEKAAIYAFHPQVKQRIKELSPITDFDQLVLSLNRTNECLSSIQREQPLPLSAYTDLSEIIPLLKIENYQLEAEYFLQIKNHALICHQLVLFIEENIEYFDNLHLWAERILLDKSPIKLINSIFNKKGELKDNASPLLKELRLQIKHLQSEISIKFNGSLKHNGSLGLLDSTQEGVFGTTRVLAVKSMHRKKIKGKLLSTSKTGTISFILPDAVLKLNQEWEESLALETEEIRRILTQLTRDIAPFSTLISNQQEALFTIDQYMAKALYAQNIQGKLPRLSQEQKILSFKEAYHPLLYPSNLERNIPTIPQTLCLNKENQLIVISGPNAGGKSITLKTVGLLVVMLQSGFLIPVHPDSQLSLVHEIFTDIGDGQSIENQLSTYSYRLKKMKTFLDETTPHSLLLVDEFGTGSDPDLGGALAEVFLEEFYEKGAFGVFTTHYSNIKIRVESLENATNACMLFNEKDLQPLFILEVGEAGSSFTFEVAEKNRIPYRLINRARKKVEENTQKLDKTIVRLQNQKINLKTEQSSVDRLKKESLETQKELSLLKERTQSKLLDYQEVFNEENKLYQLGKKIKQLEERFFQTKNKKDLIKHFVKLIEINLAKKAQTKMGKKKLQQKKKELETELETNKKVLAEKKKETEENTQKKQEALVQSLSLGDRVKIIGSSSIGTIHKIERNLLFITYGNFTTKIKATEVVKV